MPTSCRNGSLPDSREKLAASFYSTWLSSSPRPPENSAAHRHGPARVTAAFLILAVEPPPFPTKIASPLLPQISPVPRRSRPYFFLKYHIASSSASLDLLPDLRSVGADPAPVQCAATGVRHRPAQPYVSALLQSGRHRPQICTRTHLLWPVRCRLSPTTPVRARLPSSLVLFLSLSPIPLQLHCSLPGRAKLDRTAHKSC